MPVTPGKLHSALAWMVQAGIESGEVGESMELGIPESRYFVCHSNVCVFDAASGGCG